MPRRRALAAALVAAGHQEVAALRYATLLDAAGRALDGAGVPAESRRAWIVPGRIELFGKHVDYAGGRSLLCAVDRGIVALAAPIEAPRLVIDDVVRQDRLVLPLIADLTVARGWAVYPSTVARRLMRNFTVPSRGVHLALASDLPSSSGLSSSSALVVATALAFAATSGLDAHPDWAALAADPLRLAGYLGALENGAPFDSFAGEPGVGTRGGAQDHTAILCTAAGHVDQFAWLPVRRERRAPFPSAWRLLVGVSGVTATKSGGARGRYNRASRLAAHLLGAWQRHTGRDDATLGVAFAAALEREPAVLDAFGEALASYATPEFSAAQLRARLAQFRFETEQAVPAAASAFERADAASLGALSASSQEHAEVALANQIPETMALVRTARAIGAHAASAFGAGFGGSVWALVDADDAEAARRRWQAAYRAAMPAMAGRDQWFITQPSLAAAELSLP